MVYDFSRHVIFETEHPTLRMRYIDFFLEMFRWGYIRDKMLARSTRWEPVVLDYIPR
jgi:hypothetical protein